MGWPSSFLVSRRGHRRVALWLVVLALVAQQLGSVAHGAMQLRHALAGPSTDFCTTVATADGGVLPAAPIAPVPTHLGDAACTACTLAAAAALPPSLPPAHAPAVAAAASPTLLRLEPVPAEPRSAHRSRAPPAVIA